MNDMGQVTTERQIKREELLAHLRQISEGKLTAEQVAETTGLTVRQVQARLGYFIKRGELPPPKGLIPGQLRCPECGATHSKRGRPFSPTWLSRHRTVEHGVMSNKKAEQLRTAFIRQHYSTPNGHFKCPVCDRTFDTSFGFSTHLRRSAHGGHLDIPDFTRMDLQTAEAQATSAPKQTRVAPQARHRPILNFPGQPSVIRSPYGDGSVLFVGADLDEPGRQALYVGYKVQKLVLPNIK